VGIETAHPPATFSGGFLTPPEALASATGFEPTSPSIQRFQVPGFVREGESVEERAFVDIELGALGSRPDPPGEQGLVLPRGHPVASNGDNMDGNARLPQRGPQ